VVPARTKKLHGDGRAHSHLVPGQPVNQRLIDRPIRRDARDATKRWIGQLGLANRRSTRGALQRAMSIGPTNLPLVPEVNIGKGIHRRRLLRVGGSYVFTDSKSLTHAGGCRTGTDDGTNSGFNVRCGLNRPTALRRPPGWNYAPSCGTPSASKRSALQTEFRR